MKKKSLQRTIGVTLSMTMMLGMLAGCGSEQTPVSNGETSESKSTETVVSSETTESTAAYEYETGFKVTLSGPTGTTENWDGTMVVELLEQKFGVDIEATPHNGDVWETKWNLMMAEEDMADLVTNTAFTLAQVSQWGADGYLLPINEYLEHMPNLTAFFESHPDYKAACTSPDGNIYGLQYYSESIWNNVTHTFINEDWLNRVGKKYPTNLDELYDVLKAFKEQDANGNGDPNDEIPFAWTENFSRKALHNILNACGIVTQTNTAKPWGILEVSDDGEVYLADATDNYRYFLTYMNKLWEEGLCLSTAYTSTKAEVQSMIKENIIGVMAESSTNWPISEDDKNPNVRWEYLGGLTSAVNELPIIGSTSPVSDKIKLAISADTEHPEEICRLVDFFYSEDGMRAAKDVWWYAENYEEIGKGYYFDKENPIIVKGLEDYPVYSLAEEAKNNPPAGYEKWDDFVLQKMYINEGFNMVQYVSGYGISKIIVETNAGDEICDNMIEANYGTKTAMMWKRMNDPGEAVIQYGYPILVYDTAVIDERSSIWTDLFLLCQTAQAQFITGEMDIESDADWNAFIENLKKAGLERLLEIEQTSYNAIFK
ncbi:MAG: extracellular solute-binding protein [Lachnospiraceae bacterium]|nr:extracellular solute-binding protein [Lachnospiraceae bacterium]